MQGHPTGTQVTATSIFHMPCPHWQIQIGSILPAARPKVGQPLLCNSSTHAHVGALFYHFRWARPELGAKNTISLVINCAPGTDMYTYQRPSACATRSDVINDRRYVIYLDGF